MILELTLFELTLCCSLIVLLVESEVRRTITILLESCHAVNV